jgi:hypothetical protein
MTQLVKKFPAFYGIRRFIIVFITVRHWSLSWARWVQFTLSYSISIRCNLILCHHLRLDLPSGLFPSDLPTKILYGFLIFTMRATCPAHLILFDSMTVGWRQTARTWTACGPCTKHRSGLRPNDSVWTTRDPPHPQTLYVAAYILHTNLLTPWCRILFEKLNQLVKKHSFLWNPKVHHRVHTEPATGPYPEPAESSSLHRSLSP